jgi:transcriptional regulator with XRE-family HTH domain
VAEYDDFCGVNNEKKICKEIGVRLKELRVKNGYSSYENFALEHDLSRMQYWRIEKGLTNLTMRSLIKILNIHKIGVEDFFHSLLSQRLDGKLSRSGDHGRGAKKRASSR